MENEFANHIWLVKRENDCDIARHKFTVVCSNWHNCTVLVSSEGITQSIYRGDLKITLVYMKELYLFSVLPKKQKGLSQSQIIGIAVGASVGGLIVIVLLSVLLVFLVLKKRSSNVEMK